MEAEGTEGTSQTAEEMDQAAEGMDQTPEGMYQTAEATQIIEISSQDSDSGRFSKKL